jgi:nucleoside 2-deoxyribosyltransferase
MKIYLAGPDVFRHDVLEWADSVRELCRRYGFEPLLPVDHEETEPDKIFQANIDLIRKAQVVAANLDPFRGPEPDSGTAFELGYALALGKKIAGYVTSLETVADRVTKANFGSKDIPAEGDLMRDYRGMVVENFGLPCNLMLSIPAHIVEGGLEACLKSLRARPGVRPET